VLTLDGIKAVLKERGCKPRLSRGHVYALCPAHDDRDPSLSLTEAPDIHDPSRKRILLKCHAGCKPAAILAALGLRWGDINAPRPKQAMPRSEPLAVYPYRDDAGQLLYEKVRWPGKGFPYRRPPRPNDKPKFIKTSPDGRKWVWNLHRVRKVLYRLPETIAAVKAGRTIWIVEGEKDAGGAASLGLDATTNPEGSSAWRSEYSECLSRADVVVVPDNDDVGRAHATQIVESLDGVARRVRMLQLPGAKTKDLSDWLDSGGTPGTLLRLLDSATTCMPEGRGGVGGERKEESVTLPEVPSSALSEPLVKGANVKGPRAPYGEPTVHTLRIPGVARLVRSLQADGLSAFQAASAALDYYLQTRGGENERR